MDELRFFLYDTVQASPLAPASYIALIMLHCSNLFIFLSPSLNGEQVGGMAHVLLLLLLLLVFMSLVVSSGSGT